MQDVISSVEIQNTTAGILDMEALIFSFSEKHENVFSEIVKIHFCGRTYFLPGYITEKDAAKCIEKLKNMQKYLFGRFVLPKSVIFWKSRICLSLLAWKKRLPS